MGNFAGGSAYAMGQQIADGYVLVTERTFRRMQAGELNTLLFEIEKLLRNIRAEPQPDDVQELQKRNRRMMRLSQCRQMIQSYRMKRR